jgi:hypothetical protein
MRNISIYELQARRQQRLVSVVCGVGIVVFALLSLSGCCGGEDEGPACAADCKSPPMTREAQR